MNFRNEKLSQEIGKHIGRGLQILFPSDLISIVKVDMPDLTRAIVFLSIFSDTRLELFKKVRKQKKEFKKILADSLKVRKIPDIFFNLDDTIEYTQKISNVISSLKKEQN